MLSSKLTKSIKFVNKGREATAVVLRIIWNEKCSVGKIQNSSMLKKVTYIHSYHYDFFHLSMALQPFVGPWPLLQFLNHFYTTVGLLGQVIRPS
jgi:hypothetical protein